ncbi:ABC transporter substrate-binding protein [Frigoribacterium sp. CG_9.8]|uniref:ABC transporter substrate-binding protein n=1 Tax=Frigoribacterium sp. CG_9.8 TaxID=2787733 RepID=UPI0018C90750|nr:extracellular solute-binding protein [Frigoribacterium sp. CG_9.8]MBG6107394.1 raffinose/stachyose/melibiose transport system substrate-binding protein [Frigoribacterium sp. CG_9.8]
MLRIFVHSNGPTDAGFKKINALFEKQNPGVKVEMTTAVGADFATTRNTRMTAKDVDITEGSEQGGTSQLPAWAKDQKPTAWVQGLQAGNWVDLTDQSFLKNFSSGILKKYEFKGKQYAVPTGTSHLSGVFYNKALFAKYNLAVPTTWGKLETVMKTLKANGVAPFIIGGKDSWPASLPIAGLVQSIYPDPVALDKGLWEGKVSLTDPKAVEVMDKLKTIYANTASNWAGMDYASIPSRFVKGEGAMLPDGGWEIPAIQTADPKFEFGYFPMPGSDNAANNKYIASKLEFSLSIPSSSKNQDLAKKWLALYSDPKVYADFIGGSGFGPAQPDLKLPAVLSEIQQYLPPSGFTPGWDQVFHPNTKAGPLAMIPFAFSSVAPLGTETDMAGLAQKMDVDWKAGLK